MQRDRWNHTASILCQQANLNRGSARILPIKLFHPYWIGSKSDGIVLTQDNLADFKPWFAKSLTISAAEAKASVDRGSQNIDQRSIF